MLHSTVRLLLAPETVALNGVMEDGAVLMLLLPPIATDGVEATVTMSVSETKQLPLFKPTVITISVVVLIEALRDRLLPILSGTPFVIRYHVISGLGKLAG
jgi:hypothetical protein